MRPSGYGSTITVAPTKPMAASRHWWLR